MSRELDDQLLSVVNASGFPFQIRVASLVEEAARRYGWEVLAIEHPWGNSEDGSGGFVDLVLCRDRESLRLVVECKRARDSQWVFITSDSASQSVELARGFVTSVDAGSGLGAWADIEVAPGSAESSFCAVRGDGSGRTSLLERLSAEVCRATEAFAQQELATEMGSPYKLQTLYLPVIVTNLKLYECRVNPGDIDLSSGNAALEDVEFVPTSIVRFRKPLRTPNELDRHSNIRSISEEAERTVLVLSADDLAESLKAIRAIRVLPDSPRARYAARLQ